MRVSRITLYPVKSLAGVDVPWARVLPSGAFAGDRRWAMIDRDGELVNAKRTPRVHELAAEFNWELNEIQLGRRGQAALATFSLSENSRELSEWISNFFECEVCLIENREVGFPDDLQAPGPTIISAETLADVARWFELSQDQARRRFRANIELAAESPFWEDRLFGRADSPVRFRIGEVFFEGSNPCARCVVPTRDPDTGVIWPRFAAEFAERRQATLPSWAEPSRFDHFYRLAVNTRLASGEAGGVLHVEDVVTIVTP
ncbi:MAG TPA: MOSC N-terminal beta barrel domain-containing protein [Planctomycetaceae bacterium]|nr:MOSC N-terminal beta barrel domain-containing protein [Planctomycetaceae bacterium]